MAEQGSYLMQIDCDTTRRLSINEKFFVDFGKSRAVPLERTKCDSRAATARRIFGSRGSQASESRRPTGQETKETLTAIVSWPMRLWSPCLRVPCGPGSHLQPNGLG